MKSIIILFSSFIFIVIFLTLINHGFFLSEEISNAKKITTTNFIEKATPVSNEKNMENVLSLYLAKKFQEDNQPSKNFYFSANRLIFNSLIYFISDENIIALYKYVCLNPMNKICEV